MAVNDRSAYVASKKERLYGTGSVYKRSRDGKWVGTIEAGWTPRGTRRRITVTGRTEAEAEARLKARKRSIANEGLPAAGIGRATVKSWSEAWLPQHQSGVRPKTYATDASTVRRWIIPTIGHRKLDDLTPHDVRKVITAVRDAGRSSTTAAYAQGVLKRLLRAAIVEGHSVQPRLLETRPPAKAVSDRDAIDFDDAIAMLKAAAELDDGSRWVAAFLQGMRQGECLGLTWPCVDLKNASVDVSWQLQTLPYADRAAGTFRVPDGYEARQLTGAFHLVRPKTARGQRILPLVPWMVASLERWATIAPENPWGLVWPARRPGRGGEAAVLPQTSRGDRDAWYGLQDVARVAHVDGTAGRRYVLHEARHTTATLLLEGGVDPQTVAAILGHTKITTSRGYQHVSQALARQAMESVAGRLGLTE